MNLIQKNELSSFLYLKDYNFILAIGKFMSQINNKIKNMKRSLILEEALKMFEEYGYEELKISDLAKEVGVSVGTIYSYFKSKEELYSACILSEMEKAYEAHEKLFALDISSEEKIKRAIKIKFEIISRKRTSLSSGVLNNPFFFESHQIMHKDMINKIYEFYLEPINELKQVDIDSCQLVYILNSISNAYMLRWAEDNLESLEGKDLEVFTIFMSVIKGCK